MTKVDQRKLESAALRLWKSVKEDKKKTEDSFSAGR